ncbi:MAG: DUF892 family protein [Deltaproteobacteria bacterium]|nr:MAG: DUF892 family protein [Deltaproteobacteria bacterium]
MGHRRILKYCLTELDRVARANQLFEASLERMRAAATAPLLKTTLGEQLAVNTQIGLALNRIHQELGHDLWPMDDAGAAGIAAEADQAATLRDPAVRDVAMAQAAVRMDHWEIATYSGLGAFLRQVYQHEAADIVDEILAKLGQADRHIEALRPSLTDLAHDDERHGHATRSPEERYTKSELIR